MSQVNAVGWFDIFVDDLDRAVQFYQTVLERQLEKIEDPTGTNQMMSFPTEMNAYGAGGALTKSPYGSPGAGGTVVYFMVEDCAIAEAKVADAGGVVLKSKFSIGDFGWITMCQDTEGNIIGIHSMQ